MFSGHCAARHSRRSSFPSQLLLALGLLCGPACAWAQTTGAGLDLRETLLGIMAYTRWPVAPQPVRLCVMGSGAHAEGLLREGLTRAGPLSVVVLTPWPQTSIATQCDALYVGTLDAIPWSHLRPQLAGHAVLTMCEQSDACAAAGMVRLHIAPPLRQVRFEVNLDAVARSTLRIHPQVLKLGRRGASQPAP